MLVDGRLLAAVNEERLVRKKMVMGFPRESIAAVLEITGISLEEVDYIAVASKWGHFMNDYVEYDGGLFGIDRGVVKNLCFSVGSQLSSLRNTFPVLEKLYYGLRKPVYTHRRREVQRVLEQESGFRCPVEFIGHHFAHACSAYYSSGYDDALIVTMDVSGDGLATRSRTTTKIMSRHCRSKSCLQVSKSTGSPSNSSECTTSPVGSSVI